MIGFISVMNSLQTSLCLLQVAARALEQSRQQPAGEGGRHPASPHPALQLLRPGRPGRCLAAAGQPWVQTDGWAQNSLTHWLPDPKHKKRGSSAARVSHAGFSLSISMSPKEMMPISLETQGEMLCVRTAPDSIKNKNRRVQFKGVCWLYSSHLSSFIPNCFIPFPLLYGCSHFLSPPRCSDSRFAMVTIADPWATLLSPSFHSISDRLLSDKAS